MDFIVAALTFVVGFSLGFGAGCVFYRAQLKRNPERLDELAAAIKRAGRRFE